MSENILQPDNSEFSDSLVNEETPSKVARAIQLGLCGALIHTTYDFFDNGIGSLDSIVSKGTAGALITGASAIAVKSVFDTIWYKGQDIIRNSSQKRSEEYHKREKLRLRKQQLPYLETSDK